MSIRTIMFDIGGVLEIAPSTGWEAKWEAQLDLKPGELNELLMQVWKDGSSGAISEEEVEQGVGRILGLDRAQVAMFMGDLWDEYLGTLNVELAEYFASLRPRYQTAILSNSFAGARRKEQERYGFGDLCDLIIYSHEEGIKKPDRRIFDLACERLGAQPSEVVFVDDVPQSIEAAREAGMHGILFTGTAPTIAAIEACLRTNG
ncbi:MAG TPA: HAD family phosphatase [Chloroflexia bacterium]|nr:HAD family phosphatase [Chloroflexia bacterium]